MYEIGEMLMHPGSGVCKITDIKSMKLSSGGSRDYYVLKPIYGSETTTIYIPIDSSKINLRRLLNESEIYRLIQSVSHEKPLWIDSDIQRKDKFSQILRSGDHKKIIQLILEIHEKQTEKQTVGKKLHNSDLKTLEEAEKLIHEEFAYALKLDIDEVAPFIMKELNLIEDSDK